MLLALSVLLLFVSAALVGDVVTEPARERRALLRRAARSRRLAAPTHPLEDPPDFRERVVGPLADRLASLALRLGPRTNVETIRARLLSAGIRQTSPHGFLAVKGGGASLGALIGLLIGSAGGAGKAFTLALGVGALGFLGPDFVLSSRIRKRREAVESHLPDALDLLAVSVEAGLGFDAALMRLTEHMRGPLIEELELTLGEMRIGRSRHESLRRLLERVDSPELGSFVRSVIQADQLGMSISGILRVQAEESRRRRQAAAEERAMKAPVKMVFPTVAFIFPAMFLVILGPAMLNFSKMF